MFPSSFSVQSQQTAPGMKTQGSFKGSWDESFLRGWGRKSPPPLNQLLSQMPPQSPPQVDGDLGARCCIPKTPFHPHQGLLGRLGKRAKPPRQWLLQQALREAIKQATSSPTTHLTQAGSWACPLLHHIASSCPWDTYNVPSTDLGQ